MKKMGVGGIACEPGTANPAIRNPEGILAKDFPLSKFYSCRNSNESHAARVESASHSAAGMPNNLLGGAETSLQASKHCSAGGQQAHMALSVQVVSSHLLGVLDIESVLSVESALVNRLLAHAASEAEALKQPNIPRLFLLDGCSLGFPLGPLSARLRANSPGSKFVALLSPDRSEAEMIRLFHWGIDGMVVLDENWKSALPKAVLALLSNELWIPPEVLLDFVKRMRILLNRQLLPGQSLTARQNHVLQLLFRRLTNKEIACDLKISERTAKFHVCNVFNKLGMENRKNLFETFGLTDS